MLGFEFWSHLPEDVFVMVRWRSNRAPDIPVSLYTNQGTNCSHNSTSLLVYVPLSRVNNENLFSKPGIAITSLQSLMSYVL